VTLFVTSVTRPSLRTRLPRAAEVVQDPGPSGLGRGPAGGDQEAGAVAVEAGVGPLLRRDGFVAQIR